MATARNFSSTYCKIVSANFRETSRLASVIAEVTGLKLSGIRPSRNEYVAFLTEIGDENDGDVN
jgi:hypothetical protein